MEKQGSFDEISENITLVKLINTVGNINHVASIFGYQIFESNYKKELLLTSESLNITCFPLVGDGLITRFETVFYTFRHIKNTGKINIADYSIKVFYKKMYSVKLTT